MKIFTASWFRLFPRQGRQSAIEVCCERLSPTTGCAAPELQLGLPEAAGTEHAFPATCPALRRGSNCDEGCFRREGSSLSNTGSGDVPLQV